MSNYPKGSEWRKWDLHIHSPASFHWNDGLRFCDTTEVQAQQQLKRMYEAIENSDVSVFAITDYWTFDGYLRLKEYVAINNLPFTKTVFPGMELRVEAPVNYRLNVQVILSDKLTNQQLCDFKSKLLINSTGGCLSDDGIIAFARNLNDATAKRAGFTPTNTLDEKKLFELGAKTLEIDKNSLFKEALKIIPSGTGYILMPFDTNDGLSRLDWAKHPESANYYMQKSHIFETRDMDSKDLFTGIETEANKAIIKDFQKAIGGHPKPVICGSDAHKFSDYGKYPSNKCTWIKADPNFRGFCQIIEEPADRVYLGEKPEKLTQLELNSTKYISNLKVVRNPVNDKPWFNFDTPINPGLVAVIGKKGSGKSAFVDTLALGGKSHILPGNYSFLNEEKFKKNKTECGLYEATLGWCGGNDTTAKLNSQVDSSTENERVKYLPQKYVEAICNEYGVSPTFQREINTVIFNYVSDLEREGTTSLLELIEKRTRDNDIHIKTKRLNIETLNKEISQLEEKGSSDYKTKIKNKLSDKQSAFDNIVAPTEVKEPKDEISKVDSELLQTHEQNKLNLKEALKSAEKEKASCNSSLTFLNSFETKASELVENVNKFISDHNIEAKSLGIDPGEVIKITLTNSSILEKRKEVLKKINEVDILLGISEPNSPKNLRTQISLVENQIETISKHFNDERKAYRTFLDARAQYEAKKLEITGTSGDSSLNTIVSLVEHLKYLNTQLSVDLDHKKSLRNTLTAELYGEIKNKVSAYEKIYSPLIDFTKKDVQNTQLTFNAEINFDIQGFTNKFLEHINRSKDGSFQGKEEGAKVLKQIIQDNNFDNQEQTLLFIGRILSALNKDLTDNDKTMVAQKQLSSKATMEELYNYLYKLEYLDVEFNVLFNGKDLNTNEFSPGEKGALLLIFYLLIDKSDAPLIIDQPEENLDNESVYKVLVPHIKEVKKRRQIIIVTHNPNLAVVCDAEQIIFASMDKKSNEIRYSSGSLEDMDINKKVVNILEGTMPAFSKRHKKYIT